MPVVISNVNTYTSIGGTAPSTQLNTEVTIVEITAQGSPASIIEGYIDLSPMTTSDVVVVAEYIALDGTNYVKFLEVQVSGAPNAPLLRFHSKIIPNGAKYKVTVNQTAGSTFSVNYWFAEQQMSTA